MPFTRATFLGASLLKYQTSLGWNEQPSTLTAELVEDPSNGDSFVPGSIGGPVYFQHENLQFYGLLQQWTKRNNPGGLPTYEVRLQDPRDILAGTQVIVRDYNGVTNSVANLLNPYGYIENANGFGAALVNDGGMPWYLVKQGIDALTALPTYGSFGGPLTYRGVKYSLDLSQLPVPPSSYRIPANDSLLTLISQLCEDGGCDYFVNLDGYQIKVRTVSRASQPPLGTITTITNTNWGSGLKQSHAGLEARNDTTSAFLVGGFQTALFQASGGLFKPFWGVDALGQVIVGSGNGDEHTANLNATPVADVLGSLSYPCNILEMRCALANQEMWAAYIHHNRSGVAAILGMTAAPFANMSGTLQTKHDITNEASGYADLISRYIATGAPLIKQNRLYEFVRQYAQEYYGKKYLVHVPSVSRKVEPDTLREVYSHEPADGAWVEEGYGPLGLNSLYHDQFQLADGRFKAFIQYATDRVDFTRLQAQGAVAQNSGLYVLAQMEPQLYFTLASGTPSSGLFNPNCVLSVQNPVYELMPYYLGDLSGMASVLQTTSGAIVDMAQDLAAGGFNLRLQPPALFPLSGVVPLRSNVLTYGPWYAAGPSGRVKFEQDHSLVPWNYGGFTLMNAAANAKVLQAITYMTEGEAGALTLAEAPRASLGDVLQAGGPNVTNISVDFGPGGVTSTYEFRTFTPRFGTFWKGNAERLRRLGQTGLEVRRGIRQSVRATQGLVQAAAQADAGAIFNGFLSRALEVTRKESPHEVLVGTIVPGTGLDRSFASSMTFEEAVLACNAHDINKFRRTAVMGLTGLVRPYSTKQEDAALPYLNTSSVVGDVNGTSYNPLRAGHDVEVLVWGSGYQGLHAIRRGADAGYSRGLALKGPVVVTGWGRGIDGRSYYPNVSGAFEYQDNYLRRPRNWPVGPVDLMWDATRNVWSSRDILVGTIGSGGMTDSVSGAMSTDIGEVPIYNWFTSPISITSAKKVIAGWSAHKHKYFVVAMDC